MSSDRAGVQLGLGTETTCHSGSSSRLAAALGGNASRRVLPRFICADRAVGARRAYRGFRACSARCRVERGAGSRVARHRLTYRDRAGEVGGEDVGGLPVVEGRAARPSRMVVRES